MSARNTEIRFYSMSGAVKITLIYVTIGILWILLSDILAASVFPEPDVMVRFQTAKGWFYVAATGILLYYLIHRHTEELERREREKEYILQDTVKSCRQILTDFKNKMTVFRMKAERTEQFDKDLLDLYDQVIRDAEKQISKVGDADQLSNDGTLDD